jgi:hypothetical protein
MPSTCAAQPKVLAKVTVRGRRILLEALVEDRQLLLRLQLRDLRLSAAAAIISKILPT